MGRLVSEICKFHHRPKKRVMGQLKIYNFCFWNFKVTRPTELNSKCNYKNSSLTISIFSNKNGVSQRIKFVRYCVLSN